MSAFVLTANHLQQGHVLFLGRNEEWVTDINDAAIAASDDESAALEAQGNTAKDANFVVDPYLIEITDEDGRIVPVKNRERFRAIGPSVRRDLGYQGGNWKSAPKIAECCNV